MHSIYLSDFSHNASGANFSSMPIYMKNIYTPQTKQLCNTLEGFLEDVCMYLYKSMNSVFEKKGDYCLGRKTKNWGKISLIRIQVFVSWITWAFGQTTCLYVHLFLEYPQLLLIHSFWLKYVAGFVFSSSSRNKLYFQLQL